MLEVNEITELIIEAAIKIHISIGPGCFEKIYEEILYYELNKKDLNVKRQLLLPITYEELRLEDAYKLDLLVEDKVIVDIKSNEHILPVHFKQVITCLKLKGLKNGLLLNFKVDLMKEGVHRVFNNLGK